MIKKIKNIIENNMEIIYAILASIFISLPIAINELINIYLIPYSEWFYIITGITTGTCISLFALFVERMMYEIRKY